jgi:hypothetical protein
VATAEALRTGSSPPQGLGSSPTKRHSLTAQLPSSTPTASAAIPHGVDATRPAAGPWGLLLPACQPLPAASPSRDACLPWSASRRVTRPGGRPPVCAGSRRRQTIWYQTIDRRMSSPAAGRTRPALAAGGGHAGGYHAGCPYSSPAAPRPRVSLPARRLRAPTCSAAPAPSGPGFPSAYTVRALSRLLGTSGRRAHLCVCSPRRLGSPVRARQQAAGGLFDSAAKCPVSQLSRAASPPRE